MEISEVKKVMKDGKMCSVISRGHQFQGKLHSVNLKLSKNNFYYEAELLTKDTITVNGKESSRDMIKKCQLKDVKEL